jgi:hypothetical protein
MSAFDLPAELAKVDAAYVPVVIEHVFGPLVMREVRMVPGPLPTCPECLDICKTLGWGNQCVDCYDAAENAQIAKDTPC